MSFKGLTSSQGFSLLFEATSARQLLTQGHQLLLSEQAVESKIDAILTCLSIGAEKVLKVIVGMSALDKDLPWPNLKSYSHDLNALDAKASETINEWISQSPRSAYLTELHLSLGADPIWPELRALLSSYGSRARFFHLDSLGNQPQQGEAPTDQWTRIENIAISVDPRLRDHTGNYGDMSREEFSEFLLTVNSVIAQSLVRWWFTTTSFGIHGAFGVDAVNICADVQPQNALPRISFNPLERNL